MPRLRASALLAGSMVGIPVAIYPFIHEWYGLGIMAVAAEVCVILAFRKLSKPGYSSAGAIIAGIIGLVLSADALGRTAVGASGVERTDLEQFELIFVVWLCGVLTAFLGSLVQIKIER